MQPAVSPRSRPSRSLPDAAPGEFRTWYDVHVPGFRSRAIRIYLPRGYNRGAAHPVLYAFDGQNLFGDQGSFAGGWHLHHAADALATRTRAAPIVVGIDHGGSDRISELSPFDTDRGAGRLDGFLDWMVHGLMPRVAGEFRTMAGPAGAAAGGSSMGGLAAFYAHLRHPGVFGGAMVMSPSFWLGRNRIFDYAAEQGMPWTTKIYLDCGAREARGAMLHAATRMAHMLAGKGYGPDKLWFRPDPRGTHSELHWRRRAPGGMRFLFAR